MVRGSPAGFGSTGGRPGRGCMAGLGNSRPVLGMTGVGGRRVSPVIGQEHWFSERRRDDSATAHGRHRTLNGDQW
jgi:hypothetical protein